MCALCVHLHCLDVCALCVYVWVLCVHVLFGLWVHYLCKCVHHLCMYACVVCMHQNKTLKTPLSQEHDTSIARSKIQKHPDMCILYTKPLHMCCNCKVSYMVPSCKTQTVACFTGCVSQQPSHNHANMFLNMQLKLWVWYMKITCSAQMLCVWVFSLPAKRCKQ